jgi:hypothetical protein
MIPNRSKDVQVLNNIDADVTGQFTVDENSLAKIMSVLTNLYSDPELAVVREYLTNALDAQIEAQQADPNYVWRPIDVTTPSHFNKEYKVRDYGIGMSVDDIKEIYSKYGKSTKEQSNAVTGMLGLGSKCALTYTGQFTITGFKNGVRTRAVVSKDDNDIPVFMIVDTRATDEPNGVEISVPVRDRNSFAEKTRDFLRWWKEGQVLVNGSEPTKHGLTEVKPGVYLIETEGYRYGYDAPQSYVIMGNVPYQVDAEYVDESLRSARLGFAAYVDMGAVDFPPSREKLFYNNRTKATVKKISEGLFEAILAEKIKEIVDAPDFRTAWQRKAALAHHFARHPKVNNLKYKGESFPDRVQHQHMRLDWDWQGHGQIQERHYLDVVLAMQGTLIVTGVTQGTKPTSYFKKKVKHYMEVNSISGTDALLTDDDVDNKWFDWIPRIDAETIKAIKLPKNPGQTGPRAEAPYDWYRWNGKTCDSGSDVTVRDAGTTLVYISPQDMKETYRKSGCSPEALAQRLGDQYTLVVLGKNRFEKFLRTHSAIKASDAVQNRINAYVAATTDAEFTIGKLEYGEREFLDSVKVADLLDPDLADLAKLVQSKAVSTNYAKAEELVTFARRADIHPNLPAKKAVKGNVVKRYPLINHVGGRQIRHLTMYVNAVFNAEYANKTV